MKVSDMLFVVAVLSAIFFAVTAKRGDPRNASHEATAQQNPFTQAGAAKR